MFFMQTLSGAVFVSVGQSVLNTKLVSGLTELVQGIEPTAIVNTGATEIRNIVPAEDLHSVLVAYNAAIRQTFVVACATACLALPCALLVSWKNVKSKQGPGNGRPASGEGKQGPEKEAEQV